MKLVSFDNHRIGMVIGDAVIDVTQEASIDSGAWPPVGMLQVIAAFDRLKPVFEAAAEILPRRPLSGVRLLTPIEWPNKVIALPSNFHAHIEEMGAKLISTYNAAGQGFFFKANSSLSGPSDPIILPDVAGREIHHECEFAIIIGKGGRDIVPGEAMKHVFGYSCLVDMVIRGKEERVMRKAFDSFCPVGPWITTVDEAPPHDEIEMELSVNGVQRQQARSSSLIVKVPDMVSMASSVMTLYPGDIIASGTPAGVGPVQQGDVLEIKVKGIGEMTLNVVQGMQGRHPVWNDKA
jgi:2-keto-4-pentenoate hydratase/2-oxohepta-3-ene-1,7-dioic acid hydratase in catechol pathway